MTAQGSAINVSPLGVVEMLRFLVVFPFLRDLTEAEREINLAIHSIGVDTRECVFLTKTTRSGQFELATETIESFQLIEARLTKKFGRRILVRSKDGMSKPKNDAHSPAAPVF
ncbi:hypothetical protein V0U79_05870 [Hyphobacterium sp. HN65]|uniref:Uncharacterized protein n=1 Tax=Hyphobacterium lacteum TaxID=3116575 RepID=A0ABU7LQH3_9PROT|nr:hypothetical protein [Hyphobacterium sp. HN65]MEE2525886.1 hypothetical protein [Hyphobacterium sp. HN65]